MWSCMSDQLHYLLLQITLGRLYTQELTHVHIVLVVRALPLVHRQGGHVVAQVGRTGMSTLVLPSVSQVQPR